MKKSIKYLLFLLLIVIQNILIKFNIIATGNYNNFKYILKIFILLQNAKLFFIFIFINFNICFIKYLKFLILLINF